MYPNLLQMLKTKGISINAAAAAVNMPEPTFRTKATTRSFTVDEAFLVKDRLFIESDIRYLFMRTDNRSDKEEN